MHEGSCHCGAVRLTLPETPAVAPAPGARQGVNLGNFDPRLIATTRVRRFDGADTWKFFDELVAEAGP